MLETADRQRESLRAVLTCEECETETEVDERVPGWRAYILPGPGLRGMSAESDRLLPALRRP